MKRRMTFVALKAIYSTLGSFIASWELLWAQTRSLEPEGEIFLFWLGFGSCLQRKEILWLPGYLSRVSNRRSSFRDFFTWHTNIFNCACESNRELKQPRLPRQQKPHKFAYLTMKNITLFLHALHVHFSSYVLVLSTRWNDMFCSCVDNVSMWAYDDKCSNVVFLCPKRWFQFNSKIIGTHFSRQNDFE